MAYQNPARGSKQQQPQAASSGEGGGGKKKPTFHAVLCSEEGELISWADIGADSTHLSTEVKKYGDQKNASVGAIWMAESGNSGMLRIGDLTFKVFPNKEK